MRKKQQNFCGSFSSFSEPFLTTVLCPLWFCIDKWTFMFQQQPAEDSWNVVKSWDIPQAEFKPSQEPFGGGGRWAPKRALFFLLSPRRGALSWGEDPALHSSKGKQNQSHTFPFIPFLAHHQCGSNFSETNINLSIWKIYVSWCLRRVWRLGLKTK